MNTEQISKINIKGFKSIKDCHLDMKMINVLIGSNGAGKSNFISVFKLLQDIIEQNLKLHVGQAGGANALMFNGRKATESIEIEFEFGRNAYRFFLIPTDDDRLIFKDEAFAYSPFGYTITFFRTISQGHEESLWRRGTNTNYDRFVQPILEKQKWRLYHFHDTSKGARVKQSGKVENNDELLFDAGNLASFLFRIREEYTKDYLNIINAVKLVAPFFDDFYLKPTIDGENITLRWKQNDCDDIFNANQLSDGTLRFICLATLLLQPSKLQPESIVIDEPELGLHPYAITALAEIIKTIAMKKQIIISTQSVELLNEFDFDDVVVVNRGDEGTKFTRLNENDLTEWLKTDYSLGDLWKKNILGGRFSK